MQEPQSTNDFLTPVYEELRRLAQSWMNREIGTRTLQPTALVHEAYLRLSKNPDQGWDHAGHFFAAAAESMRRILVETARRRRLAQKSKQDLMITLHGENQEREIDLNELLTLDDALSVLGEKDPRAARIVKLRYFAGLSTERAAEVLGLSPRTVFREWSAAKAWLITRMEGTLP